jgi:hypothetical protein
VALVPVAIVGLSALDMALTVNALERGAVELNPVMAALLGGGTIPAVAFKLTLTLAVAAAMWILRGYRQVLELSLLVLAGLGLLIVYHVIGLSLSV